MKGFTKQDFVKKKGGGLAKTFLIKRGVGAKGGTGTISYFEGKGGDVFKRGRGFIPWCPLPNVKFLA